MSLYESRDVGFEELRAWIRRNRPDLQAELAPMTMEYARRRLNEITDLSVAPSDVISSSSQLFLQALQEQQNPPEQPPGE